MEKRDEEEVGGGGEERGKRREGKSEGRRETAYHNL